MVSSSIIILDFNQRTKNYLLRRKYLERDVINIWIIK